VRATQLEVYELATGRLLGAAVVAIGDVRSLMFVTPDRLQVVEESAKTLSIRELDLRQRKLTTAVERPLPIGYQGLALTADGSRLFLPRDGAVIDTHTGATLATLPVRPERPFFSTMLRDGSTVVTRDSKLYYADRNGTLIAEIPIPVRQAAVVGQLGASKVLLAVTRDKAKQRMLIVDLAARRVQRSIDGLVGPIPTWTDPVLRDYRDDGTFVALDANRKLVLWNARTGARKPFPS
jgi:hypothetical protein